MGLLLSDTTGTETDFLLAGYCCEGWSILLDSDHYSSVSTIFPMLTMKFSIALLVGLFALPILVSSGYCQGLPNGGFEDWTASGRPAPFDWEEPTGWKSTNATTEFTSAGIRRSTTTHTGDYACEIKTANVFGEDAPGILANGNPDLDFGTSSIVLATAGTPIADRPKKLTGFYTFSALTAGDSAWVLVMLKKYNSKTGAVDTVGIGQRALAATKIYTRFNVHITYNSDVQPDSVVVAFFSSNPLSPLPGGTLTLDDVELSDDVSGVQDQADAASTIRMYPNPVSGTVYLDGVDPERMPQQIIFYDALGKEVYREALGGAKMAIDLPLPGGFYTYRVEVDEVWYAGSLIVRK